MVVIVGMVGVMCMLLMGVHMKSMTSIPGGFVGVFHRERGNANPQSGKQCEPPEDQGGWLED